MWAVIKETISEFWADECPRTAAALAFYAVFALPALLTFTVLVAASVVDREQITTRLAAHLDEAMGPAEAKQLQELLAGAQQPGRGLWAGLIGLAVLLASVTGVLEELQTALNRAWRVEVDPRRGVFWALVVKRLISLALLVGAAGLLVASLILSWTLARFGQEIERYLPPWLSAHAIAVLHALVSLGLVIVLIAAVFKFLPDVRLRWSDVWIGATATAVLFVAGKMALGLYFSTSAPASAYGAAGSLALVLLWIYYSAQVLLLGAEFTRVLARRRGRKVVPGPGMQRTEIQRNSAAPSA